MEQQISEIALKGISAITLFQNIHTVIVYVCLPLTQHLHF